MFFNHINKFHTNITYTREIKENNRINCLDLTIIKSQNKLFFSVFYKPTHNDIGYSYNCLLHPHSHKLAYFCCYIHRLINISLSHSDYITKLDIVKQIAVNDGCNVTFIDKMIEQKVIKSSPQNSVSADY